jgi:hypothetical protein
MAIAAVKPADTDMNTINGRHGVVDADVAFS